MPEDGATCPMLIDWAHVDLAQCVAVWRALARMSDRQRDTWILESLWYAEARLDESAGVLRLAV